ncbi:MAG TPA: hypothetical protein VGL11_20765 [Candidatus Binatia bacterium]|jgi:hypothetical protein
MRMMKNVLTGALLAVLLSSMAGCFYYSRDDRDDYERRYSRSYYYDRGYDRDRYYHRW